MADADRTPHTVPEDRDLVDDDEVPEGTDEQINPLEGLTTPDDGQGTAASDADAPAPFG